MVRDALRSLWTEPRAPGALLRRRWYDWLLVVIALLTGVGEALFADGIDLRPLVVVVAVGAALVLFVRRRQPFVVVALIFGALTLLSLGALLVAEDASTFGGTATAGVFAVYALIRWGSGREAVAGMVIVLVAHFVRALDLADTSLLETTVGSVFWLFPAALAVSFRYRDGVRLRALDQARHAEREQLARELHDTVAHHVSAIAIQAQAGRAMAATKPDAALEVLGVIEEAASRTLTEMRTLVSALRDDEAADLVPQQGIGDIARLAAIGTGGPDVEVELTGELDDLRPSVDAAIYRLAQESITNARRHARHATRVLVKVAGDGETVSLSVRDDGDPNPRSAGAMGTSGYGLVGMTERARLLGGTFEAGPGADRGWVNTAVLPKGGANS